MPRFYFEPYEHRRPPAPLPHRPGLELLWQCLAIVALVLGANYIRWRWTSSLNFDALWFAIPLALAETLAYLGLVLFAFNLWHSRDERIRPPPATVGETLADPGEWGARPLSVDIFIARSEEHTSELQSH